MTEKMNECSRSLLQKHWRSSLTKKVRAANLHVHIQRGTDDRNSHDVCDTTKTDFFIRHVHHPHIDFWFRIMFYHLREADDRNQLNNQLNQACDEWDRSSSVNKDLSFVQRSEHGQI